MYSRNKVTVAGQGRAMEESYSLLAGQSHGESYSVAARTTKAKVNAREVSSPWDR